MKHDKPIIYYKHRLVWRATCAVTGKKIPAFTMAYKRYTDYLIRDEVHTETEWLSEAGYMLEKIKGNV